MKLFKRIYFIALAAAFALIFAFTIADVQGGKGDFNTAEAVGYLNALAGGQSAHSVLNAANARNAVSNGIRDRLAGFGLKYAQGANESGTNAGERTSAANKDETVKFAQDGGKDVPTLFIQTMNYNAAADEYYKEIGIGNYTETDADGNPLNVTEAAFPLTALKNIYAAFPSAKADAGTVVIMSHWDSAPMGPGAYDSMASVSAMLSVVHGMITSPAAYENNIVFVFTDGGEFGQFGAKMAKGFAGFGGAMKRVGFAANFDSFGTGGTSVMFETGANNYETVKNYAKISNSIYANSIANVIYSLRPDKTDFSAFGTAGVNFANFGQGENNGTQNDSISKGVSGAGKAFISQHGEIMGRIVKHFGAVDLSTLTAKNNAVFFTYLNFGVIYYPIIVAYIAAGLILGLLIIIIGLNIKKKAFSFKKVGLGAAAQLIALIVTVGVMFGAYYLFGLFAAWAGRIDIHMISKIKFSSPGLLFGALGFAAITAAAVYAIFMKLFKIKAGSVANGSILILCLAAAVMGFVLPAASFVFTWVALLEAVVWLLTVLFKDKFKQKYGVSMETLFLPLIPIIICLPMTLSAVMLAGAALGAFAYPVICGITVLTLGMFAPYFSLLTPALKKFAASLPERKRRQRIAGPAPEKKAKANVSKYKGQKADKGAYKDEGVSPETKYVYTTVPWKYSNWRGLTVLACAVFIFTLCFTVWRGTPFMSVSGNYDANDAAFTKDAITYVIDKQNSVNYWMVSDLDAYSYMEKGWKDADNKTRKLEGYKYDKEKKAYTKTLAEEYSADDAKFFSSIKSKEISGSSGIFYRPSPTANPNYYRVDSAFSSVGSDTVIKRYTLTFDNTDGAIKSINFSSPNSLSVSGEGKDKIVLKLTATVYFTIITAEANATFSGTVRYEDDIIGLSDRKFEDANENTLDYGTDSAYNEWKAVKGVKSADGKGGFKLAVKYILDFNCGG